MLVNNTLNTNSVQYGIIIHSSHAWRRSHLLVLFSLDPLLHTSGLAKTFTRVRLGSRWQTSSDSEKPHVSLEEKSEIGNASQRHLFSLERHWRIPTERRASQRREECCPHPLFETIVPERGDLFIAGNDIFLKPGRERHFKWSG